MAKAPPGRAVHIRRRGASADTAIMLTQADFLYLRQVTIGNVQVKHNEKAYARMQRLGLVAHRFTNPEDGGWPLALADLTAEGRQALTQEAG